MRARRVSVALAAVDGLGLAACSEIPQDAKPYAGKTDTKHYAGDTFKGDKAKWEAALAQRASTQDDYSPFRAAGQKKQ